MTHLTMEMLLGLRDKGSEPGSAAAQEHLNTCSQCRSDLGRLHQRVAQLKALPTLRPARDGWPLVAAKVRADRWRRRSYQGAGLVGLAMAASLAITVVTRHPETPTSAPVPVAAAHPDAQSDVLQQARERSRALEDALTTYGPGEQALEGQTASTAQALEERLTDVDRLIALAELDQAHQPEQQVINLWRERVLLLEGLVNVRATRASQVEF